MNECIKKLRDSCKGLNGSVRSDKHLNPLLENIKAEIIKNNFLLVSPKIVHDKSYKKNFDVVYYSSTTKKYSGIELKSINSSFGKNFNNRIDEMMGQAYGAKSLLNFESFGYAFVINETSEQVPTHYIDRLKGCADKLMQDGLLDSFQLIKITKKETFVEGKLIF
jgi:hypothetical protein